MGEPLTTSSDLAPGDPFAIWFVKELHGLLKVLGRELGVDRRCLDVGVPEVAHDRAEISAVPSEKFDAATVAEGVGVKLWHPVRRNNLSSQRPYSPRLRSHVAPELRTSTCPA